MSFYKVLLWTPSAVFCIHYFPPAPKTFGIEFLLCQTWPQGGNEQADFLLVTLVLVVQRPHAGGLPYTSQGESLRTLIEEYTWSGEVELKTKDKWGQFSSLPLLRCGRQK